MNDTVVVGSSRRKASATLMMSLKTKTFGRSSFDYPPIFLCFISGKFQFCIFDIQGEAIFFF